MATSAKGWRPLDTSRIRRRCRDISENLHRKWKYIWNPPAMDAAEVQKHMHGTYVSLRWGMVGIGFIFPFFLVVYGWFVHNIPWLGSMSAYYHEEARGNSLLQRLLSGLSSVPVMKEISGWTLYLLGVGSPTPMRTWFVGLLFALGTFLYLYKGFTKRENMLLNAAGFCALGVALFPMEWNCGNEGEKVCDPYNAHGIFAVLLFFCMGCVAMFCSRQTLTRKSSKGEQVLTPTQKEAFARNYARIGWFMFIFPVVAWLVGYLITQVWKPDWFKYDHTIFIIEWAGIWAFALYWLLKGKELGKGPVEKLALARSIEFTPEQEPEQAEAEQKPEQAEAGSVLPGTTGER